MAPLNTLSLVGLFCLSLVDSARILGMFPLYAKSHHAFYQPLMKTLARAGHEVVIYSPFPLTSPHPNYTDVVLQNITTEGEKLTTLFLDATDLPQWKCFDIWAEMNLFVFKEFTEDERVIELIASNESFDLVITEVFVGQEGVLPLGHIFKCPVIGVQTYTTNNIPNSILGNSLSLSYIPDICMNFKTPMSFLERTINSFSSLRSLYYIYYYKYIRTLERKLLQQFPGTPPLHELLNNISLIFINDHLMTDYPRPRTPNIIPVAGIHIEPEKQLPQDIKKFMDEAPDGVILFSLGTYVPDELQPREYFDMYINVFRRLRQRVLWKTRKENIQGLPDNVMTVKWAPQQDVLAHPNCVLFITHGGLFSQHEAIHFGVPVVGVPQFGDQHRNLGLYVSRGTGVKVEIKDLSEATMSAAIKSVLSDPRYRENMKRLSQIFRDRPLSPAETVVFWTEYVLRHGGAGHLRPASTQLHWYQLALLDVLAAIFALIIAIVFLCYFVIRKIFNLILKMKIRNHNFTKKIK